MKILILLIPVIFFQYCKAQKAGPYTYNKDSNSLLWEISGKNIKKPSYLFGTFHLMCKEDINVSSNLKEVVKNTDEVYFEMDLDDLSNTLGALLFMNMRNDTTLKDLYTAEEYNKIERYFIDTVKTPMGFMQKIKPLFLQALLYPKMMQCKTMSGVEESLMKLAKENKKEIKGFETIAFQASVFDSIPYKLQAKELLKSIDSIEENKQSFNKMLTVYKNQQLSEIEKLNNHEFEEAALRETLLDKRNINWVTQLKELLPNKGLFIAVGAGHLVGKNGLIQLLQKEGYTVRPIENKNALVKQN